MKLIYKLSELCEKTHHRLPWGPEVFFFVAKLRSDLDRCFAAHNRSFATKKQPSGTHCNHRLALIK